MGSGGSVEEKIEVRDMSQEQPKNILPQPLTEIKKQQLKQTPIINKDNQLTPIEANKQSSAINLPAKSIEKDVKNNSKGKFQVKNQNIRLSSNAKLAKSLDKNSSMTTLNQPKNELRLSSLSKSKNKFKGKDEISKPKIKIQDPENSQKAGNSKSKGKITKEQAEILKIKKKIVESHSTTRMKVKGVKNHKELTDLIKVYGL